VRDLGLGLWLSWQELKGRKTVFAINIVLLALFVAIPVTLDLTGRAREASVQRRLDYIGPSLSIVPPGVTSFELATAQMKGRTLPVEVYDRIRGDFSSMLRGIEPRLIMNMQVEGRMRPVIGIDPATVYSYPLIMYSPGEDEALIGTVVAQKSGRSEGDLIRVGNRSFRVRGVIETTAAVDDMAVFVTLSVLQEMTGVKGAINEIRLFPRSASSRDRIRALLESSSVPAEVIDSSREEVAEREVEYTLGKYRDMVYAVSFVLVAFCMAISTYMNLEGRKKELSTIRTLGISRSIIFHLITGRTVWIALMGALSGNLIALVAAIARGQWIPLAVAVSGETLGLSILMTLLAGLAVAVPFSLYAVFRQDMIRYI